MSAHKSQGAPSAYPEHSWLRTCTSIVAPPLMAATFGAALAAFWPASEPWRVAIGGQSIVPLWLFFGCIMPLQRSGLRALAVCAAVCLPLMAALALRAWV
ncbi:MAG: hypothetical protein RL701_8022 [Pseudomonadota bacterium]